MVLLRWQSSSFSAYIVVFSWHREYSSYRLSTERRDPWYSENDLLRRQAPPSNFLSIIFILCGACSFSHKTIQLYLSSVIIIMQWIRNCCWGFGDRVWSKISPNLFTEPYSNKSEKSCNCLSHYWHGVINSLIINLKIDCKQNIVIYSHLLEIKV